MGAVWSKPSIGRLRYLVPRSMYSRGRQERPAGTIGPSPAFALGLRATQSMASRRITCGGTVPSGQTTRSRPSPRKG